MPKEKEWVVGQGGMREGGAVVPEMMIRCLILMLQQIIYSRMAYKIQRNLITNKHLLR